MAELVVGGRFNGPTVNANDLTGGFLRPGSGRETIEIGNVYPSFSNGVGLKDATNTLSITVTRLTNTIALPLPAYIGSPDSQADFFATIAAISNTLPAGVSITNVRKSPTVPLALEIVFEQGGNTDIIQITSNDSVSYLLKMQMLKTGWLWADQIMYRCLSANADEQIAGDTFYWGQPTFGGWIQGGSRPVRTFDSPVNYKPNLLVANGDFFLSKSKFNVIILTDDFGGAATNIVTLDYNIVEYRDNVDFK